MDMSIDFLQNESGDFLITASIEVVDSFEASNPKVVFIVKKNMNDNYFATVVEFETTDFDLNTIGDVGQFEHTYTNDGSDINDLTAVVLVQETGGLVVPRHKDSVVIEYFKPDKQLLIRI